MATKMMTWLKVLLFLGGFIILLGGLFIAMNQMRVMNKMKEREMMIRCLEIFSDRKTYPEQECEKLLLKKMRYN